LLLGDSPCLGRVIALAALVRASGLRLQYRFLIRRFRVGDWSFPLQLRPWRRTGQLDLEQVSSLVHPAALRSSSVAIAVALSPAAPIDRSSPSSSCVHGGPGTFISSHSARARPDEVIDAQGLGFIHNKPDDFVLRHRVALSYSGGKCQQIKRQCSIWHLA